MRLIGIDTPEIRIRKNGEFVYSPAPLAVEAKEFLAGILTGRMIKIEVGKDRKDKYGRLLGYCFFETGNDEVLANKLLLEEGLAVISIYPSNTRYINELIAAQKIAESQNRGIWRAANTISAYEAEKYIGQIRPVQGRVLSTYNSGKVVFLNFGSDYKKDFTVAIFKNCLPFFHKKNIYPESYYRGKYIKVTGRIRQYNGPEIIVNHPEQIRLSRVSGE